MQSSSRHGPALAAYLEARMNGQSARAFAAEHGIDAAQISKWKTGTSPTLANLRIVADRLGESLADILIAAEYGTAEDFVRVERVEVPAPIDVRTAIEQSNLEPDEKAALLGVLSAFRRDAPSTRKTFRVKNGK